MDKMDNRAKKILMIFGAVIVGIILICIIALIIGKLKNSSLTYSEIENRLVDAAMQYYSTNKEALPLNEQEKNIEVSASTLTEYGLLKELSSYQQDDSVICDGKVVVTKSGDYYNYSPYLECGDSYRTVYLYERLFDSIVESGDGLYKTTQYNKETGNVTKYIFRGEYPTNYLMFDNTLWRIVKIEDDNSILLINSTVDTKGVFNSTTWDDRYNNTTQAYSGIPEFNQSRLKRMLEKYYENVISNKAKSSLVKITNCVGTRINADKKNGGSIECSKVADSTFVSVLPLYDYLSASLDSTCQTALDKSCSNYNYLAKSSDAWWTLTINTKQNTTSYTVSTVPSRQNLSSRGYIRAVVKLNENAVYVGGDGTKSNPYLIK